METFQNLSPFFAQNFLFSLSLDLRKARWTRNHFIKSLANERSQLAYLFYLIQTIEPRWYKYCALFSILRFFPEILVVKAVQKIPIKQLDVSLFVNISEDERCTVIKTELTQVLLYEIDVVFKELRLFTVSYQVYLVACYYNWDT